MELNQLLIKCTKFTELLQKLSNYNATKIVSVEKKRNMVEQQQQLLWNSLYWLASNFCSV